MADLNQACANMGLDSSKLRPIAHATPTGRVAVYIGAAWQELPLGKALNLLDQLSRSIENLQAGRSTNPAQHRNLAPERYEIQLRQWREGIRSCPPMPELAEARREELERRAMDAIAAEVPHA